MGWRVNQGKIGEESWEEWKLSSYCGQYEIRINKNYKNKGFSEPLCVSTEHQEEII